MRPLNQTSNFESYFYVLPMRQVLRISGTCETTGAPARRDPAQPSLEVRARKFSVSALPSDRLEFPLGRLARPPSTAPAAFDGESRTRQRLLTQVRPSLGFGHARPSLAKQRLRPASSRKANYVVPNEF
jgi:hypothetical protein